MPLPKKKKEEKEEKEETQSIDLSGFNSCFRCGWGAEHGAQLEIVGNEKLCQKCR